MPDPIAGGRRRPGPAGQSSRRRGRPGCGKLPARGAPTSTPPADRRAARGSGSPDRAPHHAADGARGRGRELHRGGGRVRAARVGAAAAGGRQPGHGRARQPRRGGRLRGRGVRGRDRLGPRALARHAQLARARPGAQCRRAPYRAAGPAAPPQRLDGAVAGGHRRGVRDQRRVLAPAGGDRRRDDAARRRHHGRDGLPARGAHHARRLRPCARPRRARYAGAAGRDDARAARLGARQRRAAGRAVRGRDRSPRRRPGERAGAGAERARRWVASHW